MNYSSKNTEVDLAEKITALNIIWDDSSIKIRRSLGIFSQFSPDSEPQIYWLNNHGWQVKSQPLDKKTEVRREAKLILVASQHSEDCQKDPKGIAVVAPVRRIGGQLFSELAILRRRNKCDCLFCRDGQCYSKTPARVVWQFWQMPFFRPVTLAKNPVLAIRVAPQVAQ